MLWPPLSGAFQEGGFTEYFTQSFMLEMVCDMSGLRVLQIKYVYVRILVNLINIKLVPIVAIAPEQGLMVGLRTTTLG